MLMDVVLLGAGGHAKDMLKNIEEYNSDALSKKKRLNIIGCVDDLNKLPPKRSLMGHPILTSMKYLERRPLNKALAICAVGDPFQKKIFIKKASSIKLKFFNFIHPSVKIQPNIEMGIGISIFANSIISASCAVRDHVSINYLCSISHDCAIGDYTTLAPGVKIAGNNIISEGVFMGINSCSLNKIKIGKWSIVGGGTAVIKDVSPYAIVAGNPPKVLGKRSEESSVFS